MTLRHARGGQRGGDGRQDGDNHLDKGLEFLHKNKIIKELNNRN